jgi:hypothetical protein
MTMRKLAGLVLLMQLVLGSTHVSAQGEDRLQLSREMVLPITMKVVRSQIATPTLSGTGLVWRALVTPPENVGDLRLHVVVTGHPAAAWRLLIRNASTQAVVDSYASTSRWVALGSFWTRSVGSRAAFVDIEAAGDCSALAVAIDAYAYEVSPSTKQAIHGIDGRLAIPEAPLRVQSLAPGVVRLRIMVPNLGQATCTGFLVSDTLLMTNQHCVSSSDEANSTLGDLGYDRPDIPYRTLRVTELVAVSAPLDYALLRLEQPAPAGFARLKLNPDFELKDGAPLLVIEHPLGGYKQVSIESCEISGTALPGASSQRTDFGHKCDTLNGSSGSPVLDEVSGTVVGLHHFGFDPASETFVNRAVSIKWVVADLRQRQPAILRELGIN